MTIKQIVKLIVEAEGKKSQVSVGDVREIVGLVAELLAMNSEAHATLLKLGIKRLKK